MNKYVLIVVLAVAAYFAIAPRPDTPDRAVAVAPADISPSLRASDNVTLENAIANHLSGQQLAGQGTVTRLLPDDINGSQHQRFIVRLGSGRTILVAHNIDLAGRIDTLRAGDAVDFYGEHEWNPKGGVVHWTHRDPQGHHPAGWIKHKGQTYQ